jgi:hypothetical protein
MASTFLCTHDVKCVSAHPYFDPVSYIFLFMMRCSSSNIQKSDRENPKWYMVDVTFVKRAAKFIPLSLLRHIASLPAGSNPPEDLGYIGIPGVKAIQSASFNFTRSSAYSASSKLTVPLSLRHGAC